MSYRNIVDMKKQCISHLGSERCEGLCGTLCELLLVQNLQQLKILCFVESEKVKEGDGLEQVGHNPCNSKFDVIV